MSIPFWRNHDPADSANAPVDEQHALPTNLYFKNDGAVEAEELGSGNPLPVALKTDSTVPKLKTYFDTAVAAGTEQLPGVGGLRLFYINVPNSNTTDVFLQLFDNVLGAVTLGTTIPTQSYLIPSGNGTTRGAFDLWLGPHGLPFKNGLTYAVTTGPTSSGAPGATVVVNFVYREGV